ncbi:hypothetical protein [Burkholderia vietnamiensis]|uniref:hypothetical protein n=1 Tax=Burkholderia vietnamiensis TaxID=60552 RepID=UPI001CF35D24|nr:hypothetical protein [Burkholderia vietnamiensis]MCA7983705.1 hypothetical protein [Burkholderia vietnamiensis]
MLTADLPVKKSVKDLALYLERDNIDMVMQGHDMDGKEFFVFHGDTWEKSKEEKVLTKLKKLNSDYLVSLDIEGSNQHPRRGAITVRIYNKDKCYFGVAKFGTDKNSLFGVEPMQWEEFEGSDVFEL